MVGKSFTPPLFVLSLIVLLAACKSGKDDKKPAANAPRPASRVEAYVVTPKTLSQDIEMPGSLTAFEETELHPEVAGRVTGIYFNEGSNVSQGAVLLKLYDGDLRAQLNKLQVQLKVAKETVVRYEALLKISGVSQQEYDLNILAVNNIQADINIVQTSISKTVLRAPFSGKLGLRNISMGAYVSPQTVVSTLRKVNLLKLEFTVPEKYGSQMKTGNPINFTIDNGTKKYTAKIAATENNITADTRTLKVRAIVDKPDPLLIAGSFVKVEIGLGKNDNALMIPSQGVIPRARNKEVILYNGGVADIAIVTTGIRDSSMVEITSGLKAGDTILITGLLTTKKGSKVILDKINKP